MEGEEHDEDEFMEVGGEENLEIGENWGNGVEEVSQESGTIENYVNMEEDGGSCSPLVIEGFTDISSDGEVFEPDVPKDPPSASNQDLDSDEVKDSEDSESDSPKYDLSKYVDYFKKEIPTEEKTEKNMDVEPGPK